MSECTRIGDRLGRIHVPTLVDVATINWWLTSGDENAKCKMRIIRLDWTQGAKTNQARRKLPSLSFRFVSFVICRVYIGIGRYSRIRIKGLRLGG